MTRYVTGDAFKGESVIRYVTGDATQPIGDGRKIIAHVCNDIGVWGAGFVLAVTRRFGGLPEWQYRSAIPTAGSPTLFLGDVQFVNVTEQDGDFLYVANMIAQRGVGRRYGPPLDYEALEHCLEKVADRAWDLGASVHMPRIGCGLAGGRWELVEPIIERTMEEVSTVVVYDL